MLNAHSGFAYRIYLDSLATISCILLHVKNLDDCVEVRTLTLEPLIEMLSESGRTIYLFERSILERKRVARSTPTTAL